MNPLINAMHCQLQQLYWIKTNNYTVCGGMTGSLMPSLSAEGRPIRGGVPQSANFSLAAFLSGLSKTIATRIPDAQYDGLAVFDFEAFTPIWSEDTGAGGWHGKAYRVYSMKLVQQAHPSWTHGQVEVEATKQFEAAATQLLRPRKCETTSSDQPQLQAQ